jgi:hypothetical protein
MDPIIRVRIRPAQSMLYVVCGAVGIGIVFMAGIGIVLVPQVGSPVVTDESFLLALFLALGAGSLAAAFGFRRRFTGSAASAPSLAESMARVRLGVILGCAFSEVPAVLGLVYLVLGGSRVWGPAFFGGALASLAFVVPRPSEWEEWLADAIATKPDEDLVGIATVGENVQDG